MKIEEKCRVCENRSNYIWSGRLCNNNIAYFECRKCKYVETEWPFWLDEAYKNPINKSDTGIMMRNMANSNVIASIMMYLGKLNGLLVDFAGGYGILVRLLRDRGINAFWQDSYSPNLVAQGFEYKGENADIVTAFEAFEHFVEPMAEFEKLLKVAPCIIFSTLLIPEPTPAFDRWWYYGREHGQHIGFFRVSTLETMARLNNKHLTTDGKFYHMISDYKINKYIWIILIKLSKVFEIYTRTKLKTKTFTDSIKFTN